MDFSEQPPSKQWAALKHGGEKIAEVWFKPEGESYALAFRIPRESFQIPGMDRLLSMQNLLKTVGIAAGEVESWSHGEAVHASADGASPQLGQPLPSPPDDVTHLNIYVSIKRPPEVAVPVETSESDATSEGGPQDPTKKWKDLEARWGIILGMEAGINTTRQMMEALQAELQTALQKSLTLEEKRHALNKDVALWTKEKGRAHFALPKVRDFIHRATWALDTPERKAIADFFKVDEPPEMPLPEMNRLGDKLERLLKDRQELSARGTKCYQECKNITTDIQSALRTLASNAAANGLRKRRAAASKMKFFKDVRRMSGAE